MEIDIQDESIVSDESVIDRMMLESYGMEVTEELEHRINESLARENGEKLFGVDGFLVFNSDDTANYTTDNDVFADYVDNTFYPQIDSCSALMLIEEWSPSFMKERFVEKLNELDKGEVLQYDDFFRNILNRDTEVHVPLNIEKSEQQYALMPKIVRIF